MNKKIKTIFIFYKMLYIIIGGIINFDAINKTAAIPTVILRNKLK